MIEILTYANYDRHSAGALVAVNTYFEAPERVAALILIAPAILAPRAVQKAAARRDDSSYKAEKEKPVFNPMKPFIKLFEMLSTFIKYFIQAILQVVKGIADMINSLIRKALAAILLSAFAVMLVHEFFFMVFTPQFAMNITDRP